MVIEDLDVATNLTALLIDIISNEWTLMDAEFKLSINAYLADLSYSPVHSLADIIAFNKKHPVEVSIHKINYFHLFSFVICPTIIAAAIGPVNANYSLCVLLENFFTFLCRRG
jgi:hypothetical protein